jgi:hypothetical protein
LTTGVTTRYKRAPAIEIHANDTQGHLCLSIYPKVVIKNKTKKKQSSGFPTIKRFVSIDDPVSMTVTSNVTWIWTNLLLGLLGLVFIAALVYFKSSCIFYRKLYGSSEIKPEQHTPIPLHHSPIVNTRVLLVYDTNDDSIQKKASILRQQLICSGVSIVIYFP